MQQVEVERRYAAPVERVFEVYTDHEGWSRWAGMSRSLLVREGSPDRNGTGAVRELGSGPGKAVEEVLDFEPPKRMTYTVVGGVMPMRDHLGEVLFEPDGDGTHVVWRCRFESTVPGLGPVLRLGITGFFKHALRGLERVL